ncbi:MAG: PQQ-dependent sugar dehydrogenase [Gammaproteobacteria bacterium]
MTARKKVVIVALVLLALAAAFWRAPVSIAFGFDFGFGGDIGSRLKSITLADEGLTIGIFADALPKARQIAIGGEGWVFVGSRADSVYALRDKDGDGIAEDKRIIAKGLRAPHGVAFGGGDLYIGEIPRVLVVRDVIGKLKSGAAIMPEVFIDGLPSDGHHGVRHLGIAPDGKMLYVSFGVPCNICKPENDLAGVIRRYSLSAPALLIYPPVPLMATDGEVYARGLRNAVGFAWHPQTKVLWITDNGRDWLGDDLPGDELNRAPVAGMHFGFPYCHQGDFPDPEFGDEKPCDEFAAPALLTGAHVANLGMAFTKDGDALIALHGSWNRSVKVGYSVRRARIKDGRVIDYEDYAKGWLSDNGSVWGRPVDIAILPDGGVLVSDDNADAVYIIRQQ